MSGDPHRAVVTGAAGQLGAELLATAPEGWGVTGCDSAALDVTRREAVVETLARLRPTVVVNAAAYTAVDAAEGDAERARAVNAEGPRHLAEAAREVGARLIQISTDYVFDGERGTPYAADDPPRPLGVYGATKLAGERAALDALGPAALVLRTAWLYSHRGRNFATAMLGRMRRGEPLRVVADQVGTPTWARSLARAVWAAAARPGVGGVHHWTDAGVASWYDFAVAIQEEALGRGLLERPVPIRPIRTAEYPTPARRPAYAVLDKSATWAALDLTPEHWRASLRCMLGAL